MMSKSWRWADLNEEQLEMVKEAETTLDVAYVLAFQPTEQAADDKSLRLAGAHVAHLTESQLECLQGLEAQLDATLVAYER